MTAPDLRAAAAPPGRARTLRTDRWGVPTPAEQERLAGTVGALVSALRTYRGFSVPVLARRCAVAPSTVWRVEHGRIRPRRVLLCALAWGINPDDPKPIKEALIAAAGDLMRPDTDGALSRRRRQIDRALLRGEYALPTEFRRRWEANREGDRLYRQSLRLLSQPGALDDLAVLDRVDRLQRRARELWRQAGGPITMMVDRKPVRVGLG